MNREEATKMKRRKDGKICTKWSHHITACAVFFASFLLSFFPFSVSVLAEEQPILARAGSAFISEREFLERFELTPGLYRHRKSQLEGEKLKALYSIVAEKLLAQEALSRNLDRDSLYQSALLDLTKLLVRDELYRQEVRMKVNVPDAEIVRGMKQARTQVRVSFIFLTNEDDARFLRSRIATARDFETLVIDSTIGATRDTATVIWGDADTTIESAAYAMREGQVSEVLRAGDGFYILRVERKETNKFYQKLPHDVLRERVLTRLRMRGERIREQGFLRDVLRDKRSFSPRETIKQFAKDLDAAFRRWYHPPATAFSREMMEQMLTAQRAYLKDTILVAGDRGWTVEDAIARLYTKGFTVNGDTVRGIPQRLDDVFHDWVRQELLAQEGLQRGLDRYPAVQQHLAPWRDHYLSGMVRRRLNDSLTVSDAEAYAFMKSENKIAGIPEVQLRELRTASLNAMGEALGALERGVSFPEVVERFSSDPAARLRGGLLDFFAVTDRPMLGSIALQLDPGQMYGPFRDSIGVVLVQLVAKRNAPQSGDTSATRKLLTAKREVLRMKQQRVLTLFLSQVAEARGVEVYQDRLSRVKVTTVPMLGYRLLGFGGRMFDVPFIEQQLEWLDTEPPKQVILP
jgi:parvulin-like peptidyl-prolyl isomerase